MSSQRDLSDSFHEFVYSAAKFVFTVGAIVFGISLALLIFTCFRAGDASAVAAAKDAANNVEILQKTLTVGCLGMCVGGCVTFWGEELLGALLLIGSGALYFAPLYMPGLFPAAAETVVGKVMGAFTNSGALMAVFGISTLIWDIVNRFRNRATKGAKADQLKYGKGIKEEAGTENVFLGKCWQLPFCRKFVRDLCPIYHSKRTCWKGLVGCMCEESVIRNAMENKPVPKDALLAAKMIPKNARLTVAQKRERCFNCVIYNEHQRHKYKIAMGAVVGGYVLGYVILRGPLFGAANTLMMTLNKVVQKGTLGAAGNYAPPALFVELLLFVSFLVAMTYSLKTVEFVVFKIKI